MIRLRCLIAALNTGIDLEAINPTRLARFVAGHFAAGSGGDIQLDVQVRRDVQPILAAGEPASEFHLHNALASLTGNPPAPPINTIGLLLAHAYQPWRATLGLMFDRGVPTRSDEPFARVPREGAAVFLEPIEGLRPPAQVLDEIYFTVVHELGHVFNLWHDRTAPPSFMSTSGPDSTYGPLAYVFEPEHQDWLGRCSQSSLVRPGASRFLDRDSGFNAPNSSAGARASLELKIGVSPARCWRFEPIHLDIELRLKGRQFTRASMPAIIDPSHSEFRIYIVDSRGRVRRFRSSILSCASTGRVTITPSRPYRRDVPIFLKSDGYSFPRAGRYRVFAECAIGSTCTLRSNAAELEILPLAANERGSAGTLRQLGHPAISSLLYYRDTANEARLEALSTLIGAWGWRYSARQSLLAYLWSRTVTRCAPALRTQGRKRLARDRLAACLDRENLGLHRQGHAEDMLRDEL